MKKKLGSITDSHISTAYARELTADEKSLVAGICNNAPALLEAARKLDPKLGGKLARAVSDFNPHTFVSTLQSIGAEHPESSQPLIDAFEKSLTLAQKHSDTPHLRVGREVLLKLQTTGTQHLWKALSTQVEKECKQHLPDTLSAEEFHKQLDALRKQASKWPSPSAKPNMQTIETNTLTNDEARNLPPSQRPNPGRSY